MTFLEGQLDHKDVWRMGVDSIGREEGGGDVMGLQRLTIVGHYWSIRRWMPSVIVASTLKGEKHRGASCAMVERELNES